MYHAALTKRGPPFRIIIFYLNSYSFFLNEKVVNSKLPKAVIGAKKAPMIPACKAHAKCFELIFPDSYGIALTSLFKKSFFFQKRV